MRKTRSNPSIGGQPPASRCLPLMSNIEAVEKVPCTRSHDDHEKFDHSGCAVFNASASGRGKRTPENRSKSVLWTFSTASLDPSKMMRHAGFRPVSSGRSVVLILGSLPGRMSLDVGEYYAHPRNGFWKVMGELFGANPELPYAKRKRILTKNRIALWDVLAAAQRRGSLDSSIVASSMVPNDFRTFLRSHRSVRLICFNGRKAADLYRRKVAPVLGGEYREIRYETLPSTSPAHAAMSFDQKLKRWSIVRAGI